MLQRFSITAKVFVGFALAALILVGLGAASADSIRALVDTQDWVAHTQEVLHHLSGLLTLIEAANGEQRLYLIGGDERYVKSYAEYVSAVGPAAAALRNLTIDNPRQTHNLDELQNLVAQRNEVASRLFALRKAGGLDAARRAVLSGRSTGPLTQLIRAKVIGMQEEENRLLVIRVDAAKASARRTLRWLALGSGAALLFLGGAAWIIRRDIDRRQRLEEERASLFRLSLDMLCIAGFDGYFKHLNPVWEKTLGFSLDELKARPFIEMLHPEDRAKTEAETMKLLSGKDTIAFENRYLCKDGSYRWLKWNATSSAKDRMIYAGARDITEEKSVERLKDEIMAMATHELRSPLTAIHGAIVMLEDSLASADEKARSYLDMARLNSEQMLHLVNDFMDVQRLEYGGSEFHLEKLRLDELIRGAVEANSPYAQERGIALSLRPPFPESLVRVDRSRLLQIMTNLLSNAVKHSPDGASVHISATSAEGAARISIRDFGPGIPPQFRSRLFRKFAQAEGEKSGSGLGLNIAKTLVEKMGGRIWYEAAAGQGSVFAFELPEAPSGIPGAA
jgi:PAS domain S-box-containing protein